MILVHFQGKPYNITVSQVYAPTTNAEEAEADQFYEDLLELTPKKDVTGNCNAKVGSKEIPRIPSKFGLEVQNEAGQRLTEFCHTGHSKHPLPTTQKMTVHIGITRWSILKSD